MAANDEEPKEPPPDPKRGWRDVFDEIDYLRYAQQPDDNVYVYG